jgi:type I restriction enzyme S subunit
MNAELLLAHFNRISAAPDAVVRLRKFILDLAVRGKLVEQSPNDETASTLLKRIRHEKQKAVERGDARKEKPLPQLATDDLPFSIPTNWCWSQLAEIGFLNPRNVAAESVQSSFVPMASISAEYGVANAHEVRNWGDIKSGFTHFAEGDVALAKITPCFENGKSTVLRNLSGGIGAGTTELHVIRPIHVSPDFVLIFLKSPYFIGSGIPKMTGTAGQKRVPTDYFAYSPFPLPPETEQQRIVAKVDELMALCDGLEAAKREQETRRDQLTASTHHHMNNGGDADELRGHAQFFISHLPRLTTRPDQVKQLRQTILDLAVRGLLTRNVNDGAATPPIPGSPAFEREICFPATWSIQALVEIAAAIVDCPHSTPHWTNEGKICVRTNQFRPGYLDLSDVRFVSESTYIERIDRLKPSESDILYSREGGILGIACRIPPNTELCLGQRMMLIRSGKKTIPAYLELVLNSPLITNLAAAKTTGGAAPRINVATVKAYPIPLPPLAEQRCIVAKVDELMALCDQLETSLATAETETSRLLESVLHHALQNPALA